MFKILIFIFITSIFLFTFYNKDIENQNKNKNTQKRIVVSLTTSPQRIHNIKPVLDCMINQTLKPQRIYLNLPRVFKRNGSKFEKLPDFITKNPLIHVNFCDDIGPATKIIPTIYHEQDPETYILSIDDDIYYPNYTIEHFIKYQELFPHFILTGTSYLQSLIPSDIELTKNTQTKIPGFKGAVVQILEGYSGVFYKRKFFKDALIKDFYKHINNHYCRFGDDFYLSNLFKKYNTRIVSINFTIKFTGFDKNYICPLDYGLKQDALHLGGMGITGGNKNNYKQASEYLNSIGELYINY